MSWFTDTFGSSIGKKLLMSLTGIFLILFLIVHILGNIAIFKGDGGLAYNAYSQFMAHNPFIETISYVLYLSILLHSLVALWLYISNQRARPVGYAVSHAEANSTWASRSMLLLGTLVFAFIFIHMKDFWWLYKYGDYEFGMDANGHKDLYSLVISQFQHTFTVGAYLIGLVALSFHLWHGFQSAFQTLGINHKRYTPVIRLVGKLFAIGVPLIFATMPVYVYFFM